MSNGSPAVSLVYLAVGAVFGVVAFFASEGFKKRNGVTPWRLPSWVWGIIGFVSFVVCAVLIAIAARNTKRSITQLADAQQQSGLWYADPTGRFASRYWDGTRWTEHVSDGSTTTTDHV
jgi:H+/Cl- antiporter ClcA